MVSHGSNLVKNSPVNAGDLRDTGLIPGSGRSPRGRHGNPRQYSCLENPTVRGIWQAIVHRVEKRSCMDDLHTWELDYKESWALNNWCFWTVVLKETLESPLDCKEIQPVHPKGDQSWVFIGRTDFEATTPILWPPHVKSWLIGKDPDAERDWGQEEKGTTEDEMVGWHHRLNGHGFGWTSGVGDGQGGLACFSSQGRKESDMTEWLNWTELKQLSMHINMEVTRGYRIIVGIEFLLFLVL